MRERESESRRSEIKVKITDHYMCYIVYVLYNAS